MSGTIAGFDNIQAGVIQGMDGHRMLLGPGDRPSGAAARVLRRRFVCGERDALGVRSMSSFSNDEMSASRPRFPRPSSRRQSSRTGALGNSRPACRRAGH